ncbi:NAC domain-containing protein 26 [Cardamine amara subsp. amara]|uniref:NAC domain-containing protein 26 n=1 Tax=Cardamine amara subsp. amara TaxID=228776 RepID=A0ABD0YYY0_CARAN
MGDYDSSPSHWYDDQLSYMAAELDSNSPQRVLSNHHHHHQPFPYGLNASSSAYAVNNNNNPNLQCKQELELHYKHMQSSNLSHEEQLKQGNQSFSSLYYDQGVEQVTTDWRVLDKFVASQLSNDEAAATASASACSHHNNTKINASSTAYQVEDKGINLLENDSDRVVEMGEEYANAHAGSTSSSCQIDLWK